MLGTNTYSQESSLMDDETYKVLEQETFGSNLPILEDLNELDIPEQKHEVPIEHLVCSSLGKRSIKRQLEEDIYYSTCNLANSYDCTRPLNFQFTFGDGGGQDWVYSSTLKKLFIKMEKTLPLRFTWEPAASGLFLRTQLVYAFEQHKNDPVRRCYNHTAATNFINQMPFMTADKLKHIVHCVNHASSIYVNEQDHLSVLTPLVAPEPGSQYVPMCFEFFCKNSCQSGINRRATELLFTLEDERKQVLARQTLAVKICSCPKRDKRKSEAELEESISVTRELALTSTSSKMPCDKQVYKVELEIVGKENCLEVYKCAYNVMAGQMVKTGQKEVYKPYMDKILHKIP